MSSLRTTVALATVAILLLTMDIIGSGPIGVYAVIERVVFEPNEKAPERIQVWGAFSYAELQTINNGLSRVGPFTTPQRGYLYFGLPPGTDREQVIREWADLQAVAGTGQAVAFGSWGMFGRTYADGSRNDMLLRPQYDASALPATYNTNAGIIKLTAVGNHEEVVRKLRELISAKR